MVKWYGLPLGVKAPDFNLPNECTKMVHLADLIGKKPVLLAFYCSDFGVMCAVEMIGLRDRYEQIRPALPPVGHQHQHHLLSWRLVRLVEAPLPIAERPGWGGLQGLQRLATGGAERVSRGAVVASGLHPRPRKVW